MKKIAAFFTALVLFFGIVVGMHLFTEKQIAAPRDGFATWTNEAKFACRDLIAANLDEDTLLTFGSSELEHGLDTPYHPKEMFRDQKFQPMLIGAGYYQSLSHAITLAALEPDMKNRKAALIVSPQWFRKSGVLPKAFASRFSEMNYLGMLTNDKLSADTKNYIIKRVDSLLEVDEATQKRTQKYKKIYLEGKRLGAEELEYSILAGFMKEKMRQKTVSMMQESGITKEKKAVLTDSPIDFLAYRKQAELDGAANSQSNPFYIADSYYKKHQKRLEAKKDKGIKTGYSVSPEFDDLRCFLQVCQELEIQPMLIIIPVNGPWYDYTAFPKDKREEYYSQVRQIAKEHQALVADFSDREYEPYFMEDTIHIGWKGWVDVNESLYTFEKENSRK